MCQLYLRLGLIVCRFPDEDTSAAGGIRDTPVVPASHERGTLAWPWLLCSVHPSYPSLQWQRLHLETRPLKFAYTRLNSLLRTLQITDVQDFTPLSLVADFATLLATYTSGFMVIIEPYRQRTPHIPDPLLQLACLGSVCVLLLRDSCQSRLLTLCVWTHRCFAGHQAGV